MTFCVSLFTIAPKDVVKVVEVVDIRCVGVIHSVLVDLSRVVELHSVPTLVAAALVDGGGEELQANDGKGIVDAQEEKEYAQEAWCQLQHCVHDVPVPTLQSNQPVRMGRTNFKWLSTFCETLYSNPPR